MLAWNTQYCRNSKRDGPALCFCKVEGQGQLLKVLQIHAVSHAQVHAKCTCILTDYTFVHAHVPVSKHVHKHTQI